MSKEIKLTKSKIAIVDEDDYDKLSNFTWSAHKERNSYYAVTSIMQENGKYKQFRMHRMILSVIDPKTKIDHKSGDGLDNRKENLRIATTAENARNLQSLLSNNTSGFRGVCLMTGKIKRSKPWKASIKIDGKNKHIGYFTTSEEAAKAYDSVAREFFGEFCGKLNFE